MSKVGGGSRCWGPVVHTIKGQLVLLFRIHNDLVVHRWSGTSQCLLPSKVHRSFRLEELGQPVGTRPRGTGGVTIWTIFLNFAKLLLSWTDYNCIYRLFFLMSLVYITSYFFSLYQSYHLVYHFGYYVSQSR